MKKFLQKYVIGPVSIVIATTLMIMPFIAGLVYGSMKQGFLIGLQVTKSAKESVLNDN